MEKISPNLDANIKRLNERFFNCGDFVGRKFQTAGKQNVYMAYVDMLINRDLLDMTVMEGLLEKPFDAEKLNLPTVDLSETEDFEKAVTQILSGDVLLMADYHPSAVIISAKGYPNRGVGSAETEKVLQGSKEAFCEVFRINTALIRRRVRDTNLKVKQLRVGRRSQTDVALMYMEDIARPSVIAELERRIGAIDIDGISDSGSLEQLLGENWLSPFPQAQLTERPDKAASAILEGRVVAVVDNSPFVLAAPATLNTFFQSSEDYYNRWHAVTLTRLLRYAAAFLAAALPGLYLAAAVFHPSMLPLSLLMKMSEARQAVPFPALVEILLMDAAFELIKEAGVRLPGAAGSTIGIVGGLIIGQSAVEAGLVSPIVVIVAALTGVASFTVPNTALTNGIRMVKYLILLLSSVLGFLGFWLGALLTVTHLASLRSFGVPYLMPFAAGDLNGGRDRKDSLIRPPLFALTHRPFFAREGRRRRFRWK